LNREERGRPFAARYVVACPDRAAIGLGGKSRVWGGEVSRVLFTTRFFAAGAREVRFVGFLTPLDVVGPAVNLVSTVGSVYWGIIGRTGRANFDKSNAPSVFGVKFSCVPTLACVGCCEKTSSHTESLCKFETSFAVSSNRHKRSEETALSPLVGVSGSATGSDSFTLCFSRLPRVFTIVSTRSSSYPSLYSSSSVCRFEPSCPRHERVQQQQMDPVTLTAPGLSSIAPSRAKPFFEKALRSRVLAIVVVGLSRRRRRRRRRRRVLQYSSLHTLAGTWRYTRSVDAVDVGIFFF
jgi:hypothetical protein